ncbi:MAG: hypothetical protein Cons2KO_33590 [Congregibacter sp.]
MFGCVLRVCGVKLEQDESLSVLRRFADGANIEVTSVDLDWADMVLEATRFLESRANELQSMVASDGFESAELDFGVPQQNKPEVSYIFPAKIARLSGSLGISLRVSTYAVDDT